jgi:hypothetical protein
LRPSRNLRGDNHLGQYPASKTVRHRPVDLAAHAAFAATVKAIPAEER